MRTGAQEIFPEQVQTGEIDGAREKSQEFPFPGATLSTLCTLWVARLGEVLLVLGQVSLDRVHKIVRSILPQPHEAGHPVCMHLRRPYRLR